jgi:hypothetical protein
VLQDEVIRRLGIAVPEKEYTEGDCGVFNHAWYTQGQGRHVYIHDTRKTSDGAEIVAAALAGDTMSLVDREVYYAASEMQALGDGIVKLKKMAKLIGADNNSASKKKAGKAVWNEKKEALRKEMDTALMKEFGIVEWAKVGNEQHARRLSEHTALKQICVAEVTAQMKLATKMVSAMGAGLMASWEEAKKELAAPYAIELRAVIRLL